MLATLLFSARTTDIATDQVLANVSQYADETETTLAWTDVEETEG